MAKTTSAQAQPAAAQGVVVPSPAQIQKMPAVEVAVARIGELEGKYAGYTVTTDAEFNASAEELRAVKRAGDVVQAEADKIVKPAYLAYTNALAFFKPYVGRVKAMEMLIKGQLDRYLEAQKEKQREAQRIADREAQKERDRLQDRAARQAKRGDEDKAEQTMQRAQSVVAVVPAVEQPKAAGIAQVDNWKVRIKDPKKVAAQFLIPDEARMNKTAKAMGKDAEALFGGPEAVEVWNDRYIRGSR